jgi:hypothetical protein
MNRLQTELQRLYLRADPAQAADGRVRAMVLELARPASWEALSRVWQGVQADLQLPPPGIAVNGIDGYQLWFSLSEPVPEAQAGAFLEALRTRYLADLAQSRVAMHTQPGPVPPRETGPGRWSAFVSSDLAALFADEPCLDLEPGADAQAELLARLPSAQPADWRRALEQLRPAPARPEAGARPASAGDTSDPRSFLLEVMNDRAVALPLRIEAAKALLPYFEGQRPL